MCTVFDRINKWMKWNLKGLWVWRDVMNESSSISNVASVWWFRMFPQVRCPAPCLVKPTGLGAQSRDLVMGADSVTLWLCTWGLRWESLEGRSRSWPLVTWADRKVSEKCRKINFTRDWASSRSPLRWGIVQALRVEALLQRRDAVGSLCRVVNRPAPSQGLTPHRDLRDSDRPSDDTLCFICDHLYEHCLLWRVHITTLTCESEYTVNTLVM